MRSCKVNLIPQKEKYILGRIGLYIFWGIWGEAELFKGLGSKGQILSVS